MPIPKPILEACSACIKWGGGTLLAIGAGEVTGILEPTEQSLNFRRASGLDVYETNALKKGDLITVEPKFSKQIQMNLKETFNKHPDLIL